MKRKGRLLSLLMALCLLIGLLPALARPASAVETTLDGDGSETNPYEIDSAGDLWEFAHIVNGTGTHVGEANNSACAILTASFSLGGSEDDPSTWWTPIGTNTSRGRYNGTFSGEGNKISGLYVKLTDESQSVYAGLFGYVNSQCCVKDLSVSGTVSADAFLNAYAGGVVGYNSMGTVTNCSFSGDVSASTEQQKAYAGGVTGYNIGTVSSCSVSGSVSAGVSANADGAFVEGTVAYAGGVSGAGGNNNTVSSCSSACTVSAAADETAYAGGVAGESTGEVSSCFNTGAVTATAVSTATFSYVGGVAGNSAGALSSCYNTGAVTATGDGSNVYIGGVAACITSSIPVTNCYSTGAVTAAGGGSIAIGGVAGGISAGTVVTNCYSTGAVIASGSKWIYVGGLVGYLNGTMSGCYSSGAVTGTVTGDGDGDGAEIISNVGGVAGGVQYDGNMANCYHTGAVSSAVTADASFTHQRSAAGGVVGATGNGENVRIKNCFGAGSVAATGNPRNVYAGGVMGYQDGGAVNSVYYDSDLAPGLPAVSGKDDTETVTGLITARMTGEDAIGSENMDFTFEDDETSPWLFRADADGIWFYPHLKGFNFLENGSQAPADEIAANEWPAKVPITVKYASSTVSFPYDGSAHYPTVASVTVNAPDIPEGETEVKFYQFAQDMGEWKVVSEDATTGPGLYRVTAQVGESAPYDAVFQILAPAGDYLVSYQKKASGEIWNDVNPAVDAGDYRQLLSFAADGHAKIEKKFTIAPKSVTPPTAATGLKWTGEEQTGVADGDDYTVTDGAATAVGNYTATVTLDDTNNFQWSDGTTAAKEIAWSIDRADGPSAPTGLTGVAPTAALNDGKITGVTTAMEYSADGTTYTACTGTEITGLTEGTYYVRTAQTATHEAGAAATVNVPAYVAPTTYTVTVNNGTASRASAAAGESVTITADEAASGKRFKEWTGADGLSFTVGSKTTATATFTMPAENVTVTATYETAYTPEPYDPTPPTPKRETRFDEVDPSRGGSLENFKRTQVYRSGMFSDVDETAWYFENVKADVELALMEGMGDGTFGVGQDLKLSEALAIAARLHNIYYGGSGRFDQTQDKVWYQVYEDYAVRYGIIKEGEYDLNAPATRAQFALILSAALPDAAFVPINHVMALPDVAADDPRLPAILRLYNAGILTGVDAQGSFDPDAPIPREQIAAMVTRVADSALRKLL